MTTAFDNVGDTAHRLTLSPSHGRRRLDLEASAAGARRGICIFLQRADAIRMISVVMVTRMSVGFQQLAFAQPRLVQLPVHRSQLALSGQQQNAVLSDQQKQADSAGRTVLWRSSMG
jgi:hypothetical protein